MLLCSYTAAWAAQTVTVAINPAGTGTVDVNPTAPAAGATVTLTVTPAEGYKIAKSDIVAEATINPGSAQLPRPKDAGPNVGMILELQGDDPTDLSAAREYTFTMPEEPLNVLVTANFTGIPLFNITVASSEHGTVTVDKPQAAEGETVTLTITPDLGYEIAELYYMKGTEKVTITGTSFQMPAGDVEVHATFSLKSYTVTPGTCEHGSVSADKATATMGETVTLTATPDQGYELDAFTVSCETINQAVTVNEDGTFTMPADNVTVTATFKLKSYTITVAQSQNGTVAASAETATMGETVTLTITPDLGYEIDELYYMKGTEKVTITGTSFQMPAGDVEIYATFKKSQAMYLIGSFNGWNDATMVPLTKNDEGKWVGTQAMDANGTFKFRDENGGWIGAESNGNCIVQYEYVKNGSALHLAMPGENFEIPVAGTWTFTVDRDSNPMTVVISGDWYFRVETETPTNGTLSADKDQALEGETVTLTVNPNEGYEIDELYYMKGTEKVTITGTSFQMPAGDVKVYATFKQSEYNITVNSSENGSVTPSKDKATMGETITLTVSPAEGYELESLTVMAGNEAVAVANNQFTMPASDVTITATFKKSTYTITVTQPQNGTVSASAATANMGDVISLTIAPEAGYEVDQITVVYGENNTPVEVTDNQFTMPAGNVTVTVTFKAVEYTITPETCENGSVTADKEKATAGTTVTLTATAAEGYEVDKFYYKIGETQTVLEGNTFTMPASDVTVGATFKKSTYTITVTQPQNGTVSASAAIANMGDVITLTINPNDGFVIGTISVTYGENQTVEVTNNQFTMPAGNVTVTVTFVDRKYNVTVEESEHGSVSADKTEAAEGETVKLTITPEAEYELDVLTVDGVPVEVTGNTYEFAMPAHDVTVTATFKAIVHTYTVVGAPAAVFGSDQTWDLNNANALMTPKGSVYIWISEPTHLENGVSLRVVQDNSWAVAYPEQNCYIGNIKPGTYVLIVVFNPETGEVSASLDGQADVYVFGDINGNVFAPNLGLKMESEDGKIYTASVTIPDVENGYGFFAFTHKLSTDASDWGTANAYRFLAQSSGDFLVNGPTMNKALGMEYNSSNAMKIPAGEYTLTVDFENMKLTIAGGTQLSYILASGVEGVDYTVINDLTVVENHEGTQQFFTSDGSDNWITIKGGNFFADASLMDAFKGGYVSGVFSDKNLNPYLTLSVAPTEGEDVAEVEPETYLLNDEEMVFDPKVDEVIVVSKAYYNKSENTLRAYSPGSGAQGRSVTVDTSLYNYDFKDGYRYNVTGVINIKEPWATTSGINPLDYNYPFQNYKLLVLEVEELAPPTAIDGIIVEEGVKSVRYYNVAGAESTVPFNGVNIIVKEMNDGTRVTTKAIIK